MRSILDSFIEYYGDEYSEFIKKRIDDVCFFYYIDWDTIKQLISFGLKKDNIKWTDNLINVYQEYKKIGKNKEVMTNVLVGITDKKVLYIPELRNIIEKSIKGKNPYCINCSIDDETKILISFQILTLDDKAIIHEINHALTTDNIAYIEQDSKKIALVSKTGLNVYSTNCDSKETILEELINERASEDIEKVFHQKGGNLSPMCLNSGMKHIYKENLYLIDSFYLMFKDYINKARITNNKNYLVNIVGKDNYESYVDLVNKYYRTKADNISEMEKRIIVQRISILLHEMKKHALIEQKSMNKEKECIKKLSNYGKNHFENGRS